MIFHKALVREFANAALATFFVLLGITLTTQLVKLLGQAAIGLITSTGVLALLGFTLAQLSAGAALAHDVHRGAADAHAQLSRFRNGGVVLERRRSHALGAARARVRGAARVS